jgi:hypothetical protein
VKVKVRYAVEKHQSLRPQAVVREVKSPQGENAQAGADLMRPRVPEELGIGKE